MAEILIRDVDDALLARFRAIAEAEGRSLDQMLREALARGAPPAPEPAAALKALSAELRALTPDEPPQGDSTAIIRWYRDTHGGRWTDDGWAHATGA